MENLDIIPRVESPSYSITSKSTEYLRDSRRTLLSADTSFSRRVLVTWGSSSVRRSWIRRLISSTPLLIAPILTLSCFITLARFDGSLSEFFLVGLREGFHTVFGAYSPQFSLKATFAYLCFIVLQVVLFQYLPGPTNTGQRTPAGYLLAYKTNGLLAWAVTHILYASLCWLGTLDPGFIPRNWSGLFTAMNLFGFILTGFAYAKAHLMPTHPEDRNFSGSVPYDLYMGIELNPRIGNFDFKLFTNGRPGMIAWSLVDISNIAYQYQTHHCVEPSIILVTILHTIYVLDFFVNEAWYLRTIDIAHDHYGFYLAWGCFTLVPTMYTLQTQYLSLYPSSVSAAYLTIVFGIGLLGYVLFRSVNDQKDRTRRSGGKCLIWNKPAEYIVAEYRTSDGAKHESIILCSGWWGWSRHANYLGDLLLSFAMCALVGTAKLLVWLYAIFMLVLLVHRCRRDEERLSAKYGAAWEKYCKKVPWRILPGIW